MFFIKDLPYITYVNIISMKKNAIITFDYEVFLGSKTGTITNCVIKPTQYVLEILKEYNAKAVFFVDATWLLFLRENFPVDFQLVSDQIRDIIKAGSSVELHLHPQWLDAYKKSNLIEFKSFKNYRLHSLNEEEIKKLFGESIELLERITAQKVTCFRAGGFCIEPFEQIKHAFEFFGITYDLSVAPGIYLRDGEVYDFDFSKSPKLLSYKFQHNVKKHEPQGRFIEIPLSTYRNNPFYRILNKFHLSYKHDYIYGDGIGIQANSLSYFKKIQHWSQFSKGILKLDKTSNLFFKYLLKTHFNSTSLLVILSHPKEISPQALENLKFIVKNLTTVIPSDLESSLT